MLGHRKLEPAEYFSILKRHWVLVTIPPIIMASVGFALTLVIPPEYLSKTLVLIEPQKVAEEYVRPVVANDLDQRLASMTEQILSRSRLQPIIDRYSLYSNQHLSADEKIEMARKKIEVRPIKSEIARAGGLPGFNITFKNSDPHTAQLVCAEITSLFITQNIRQHEESTEGTTDFLKGQLDDAKRNLDDHDAKLAAFQEQYVGKLPGEEGTNMNMLTSINTQLQAATEALSRMEQEKSYEQAMLSQQMANATAASAGSSSQTSMPIAPPPPNPQQIQLDALQNQEADLTAHYTSDYPDVVSIRRKIADLRKEIAKNPSPGALLLGEQTAQSKAPDSLALQQLRNQVHALDLGIDEKKRQQNDLQKALGTYQERISSSPQVEQQYKELTRDYQTAQAGYNNLLVEMQHAKMATALETRQEGEQFSVMDPANLPDSPVFPKPVMFIVGGLVAGLAFGLGIVGILEYKDTALASERDIWEFTHLPTLAIIAYIPTDQVDLPRKRGLLARLNPFSGKKEATQS